MPDTEQPDTQQPQPDTGPAPLASLPRRKKRGPKPMPPGDLRTLSVNVRLSVAELAQLDAARAGVKMQRAEYLRQAWAGVLPTMIPEINREAWASLARVVGNLNQYQHKINAGEASGHDPEVIQALADQVQLLRAQLLGLAS